MNSRKTVVVSGGFDDVRSRDLRFLQETAKLGDLTVLLWSDNAVENLSGKAPKFSFAERSYFLNAVRYVNRVVEIMPDATADALPEKRLWSPRLLIIQFNRFGKPGGRLLTTRSLIPRFSCSIRSLGQQKGIRHRLPNAFEHVRRLFGLSEVQQGLPRP